MNNMYQNSNQNWFDTNNMAFAITNEFNFQSFPVSPRNSIFLVDLTSMKACIRTNPGMGQQTFIAKEFELTDVTPVPLTSSTINSAAFASKKDVDELKDQFSELSTNLKTLLSELGGANNDTK